MQPLIEGDRGMGRFVSRLSSSSILPWCWILFCGVLSVAIFLVVGRAPDVFDADGGSEAVLAKALIDSGRFVITPDFFYSTEVQIIGHHLILEIGIMLFPHNWMLARVFTLVVIMCALVASFRFCAISLDVWGRSRWIAGTLLLPFSIIYRNYYLYGMFYIIRLCVFFVAFGLCIRYGKSRGSRITMTLLAAGLGLAFGVSSFRMLLLCFLPLLIVFAGMCIAEASGSTLQERIHHIPQSGMRSLVASGIMALSSVIGVLINIFIISKMVKYAYWGDTSLNQIVPSEVIDFAAGGFIQTWGSVGAEKAISSVGVASLCGILTSLIVVMSTIVCIRRRSSLKTAQRSYVMFVLLTFLLSLAMYYLGHQWRPRYLASAAIPFVLLVPIAIGLIRRDRLLRALVLGGFMCLLLAQAIGYGLLPAIAHVRSGEPYDEEKVVAWLRNEGIPSGYATFWNCNNMVEISDGTLDIWCLIDSSLPEGGDWWSLEPFEWMAEKRHSEEDPRGEVFLLLTEGECDQAKSLGIDLGQPKNTIGNYRIFVYDSQCELYDAMGVPWSASRATAAPSGAGS